MNERTLEDAVITRPNQSKGGLDDAGLSSRVWTELEKTANISWRPIVNDLSFPLRHFKERPLRVCMLAYTFYENDGRVMRYAEALAQNGAEVEAIVLRRSHQGPEELIRGVRVLRIQSREKDEAGKFTYLSRVLKFLVRSALEVTRRHNKAPYDLIHVHSVPDFEVFAALIPRLRGVRIILDIHDIVPELYANKFKVRQDSLVFGALKIAEKLSSSFAHHVIIANDLWRERLVERSTPGRKCTSLINFPDVQVFTPNLRTRRQDGRFLIVYPGSLHYHQGLDLAIEAVALVRTKHPNVELEIWGEGPERPRLQEQVQNLGLGSYVHFHEPRPIHEIAQVMANADLGVVPKRNDAFGGDAFSTKVLEFMAVGVPLVVADTRVDQFYFDDSLLTFFRSGDAGDLARAIAAVVSDEKHRAERVARATEYVANNNWGKKRGEYLALVERLTGAQVA